MEADYFVGVAQQSLWVLALASAPILIPILVVGVLLGMVQAATSINEQTLTFVPKLIVAAICLAIFGGSILVHGMAQLGLAGPEHLIHDVSEGVAHTLALAPAVVGWLTTSALQALLAIAVGAATIIVMGNVVAPIWSRLRPARS